MEPTTRDPTQPPVPAAAPAPSTESEQTIRTAFKHIFGLFIIYAQVVVGLIAGLSLIYLLLPSALPAASDGSTSTSAITAIMALVLVVAAGVILLLASVVYRGNKLVLTNENVRQYTQSGLFHTAESHLCLANIEDVTTKKEGLIATILNYGSVVIETAGEQENFEFRYCPNPQSFTKSILDARTNYVANHPN